jgi:hypothetical protein
MFLRVLGQFRESVRTGSFVMTLHAEEEMADDLFTIFDVEQAILEGEILERQKDSARSERKYLLKGRASDARLLHVVAKMAPSGKMVIITVFGE